MHLYVPKKKNKKRKVKLANDEKSADKESIKVLTFKVTRYSSCIAE
jgi:hypothetical protein